MTWRGTWAAGTAYVVNDVVGQAGSSYICIAANTGNAPPNATYWSLVAQIGATGATGPQGPIGNTGPQGPSDGPFVIGATAAITQTPSGIVVPAYANHPDRIWTYGTYDDHFDGSTLNPKWTQTIGSGGSIQVGDSTVNLFANAADTGISQILPAAQDFTITLKVKLGGWVQQITNAIAGLWIQIQDSANRASVQIYKYYYAVSSFGMTYNVEAFAINVGANAGSTGISGMWSGEFPPYWKLQFVYATRTTTVSFSFNNLNWALLSTVSGAQSVFSTYPPNLFQLIAHINNSSLAFISTDWFRLTTP
jgi:hypothetical protein